MMFSKERAVKFLTDVLGISDAEQLLKEDRLKLLSTVMEAYQAKIPFQSLSLMTEPLSNRRRPTIEESVAEVEAGKGGLCYSVNVFLKILFDALGYTTYHTMATCMDLDNNHIMTIAKDVVAAGDRYIIDSGTGFHTSVIPLDFETESPVHDDCFLKYKYAWEDGLLKRYNLRGERKGEGKWEVFCVSDMVPKDLACFEAPMCQVYTDPSKIPFHTSMRAIKFPNQKAVCICDMKLLVEDDKHTFQETKFSSEGEFLDAVKEHFPLLVEDAKKALTNWTPNGESSIE